MVNIITIYETDDGTCFDDKVKAIEYDLFCAKIDEIMSKLVPRPKNFDCEYTYIQQDLAVFKDVKVKVFELMITIHPLLESIFRGVIEGRCDISKACPYTWAINKRCISDAVYRLTCISEESGKEYGQPYYAKHEDAPRIKPRVMF